MKKDTKKRPVEQMAVKTTIVGGRPPGPGKSVGDSPRGIEVLVKKASIDREFKELLLEKRADAAKKIDLSLGPPEIAMLDAVPAAQLEAIISKTTVRPRQRKAFLGKVAALMIVALGASTFESGCERTEKTKGIGPDRPEKKEQEERRNRERLTDGCRPDYP